MFKTEPVNFDLIQKNVQKKTVKIEKPIKKTPAKTYTRPITSTINPLYLKKIFSYKDGLLYWKENPLKTNRWNDKFAGKPAGYYDKSSNRTTIKLRNQSYTTARLIWIYHHGVITEKGRICFIDSTSQSTRIENLDYITFYYKKPLLESV